MVVLVTALLTDTTVRTSKATEKPLKLSDGRGMFLLVQPNGAKWWRLAYRYEGKQKLLSLGVYPEVTLREARDRREEARKLLSQGIDPSSQRKAEKQIAKASTENTFRAVSQEWIKKFSANWKDSHTRTVILRLDRDAYPWLGERAIGEITAPDLLKVLRRIEERGALETAHRVKQICGQVFRYAIATGRAERDPSADLKGALPPAKETHFAAIVEPKKVGELLRAIEGYEGSHTVRCALKLAPLVFVRPGELQQAEWVEFDLEKAEWNIPASRMKMKAAHLVPLSRQALEVLQELYPLTGDGKYLFPSIRSGRQPISNNTINAALRRMGFTKEEMTGHGFRAMARTILDEVLSVRPDLVEHQLAHAVRDPNGRAYNRTAHLEARREMMQQWADYLDQLKVKKE